MEEVRLHVDRWSLRYVQSIMLDGKEIEKGCCCSWFCLMEKKKIPLIFLLHEVYMRLHVCVCV